MRWQKLIKRFSNRTLETRDAGRRLFLNQRFNVTPKIKVHRGQIWISWSLMEWAIVTDPAVTEVRIKERLRRVRPMTWCTIMHDDGF